MAPKKGTKKSAGLTQPTLSFQSQRRPSVNRKLTVKPVAPDSSLRKTVSISSVERESTQERDVNDEAKNDVIEVQALTANEQNRDTLYPNGKEWDALYKKAQAEMGGLKPIHAGPDTTKVHHILRVFDMTSAYGPYVGISRLERWERAKKWGLNPDDMIKTILLTKQGEEVGSYRENVLHDWL